jgi:hypothetical protein
MKGFRLSVTKIDFELKGMPKEEPRAPERDDKKELWLFWILTLI